MEYVKERASFYELSKTVKAWERKVEIAEVGELKVAVNDQYKTINFSKTFTVNVLT